MTFVPQFLADLDHMIHEKHLLKHPFYLAWSKGTLSRECLKEYAQDYYHHVQAFPTYLSSLHSHTKDPTTRKEILNNLIEEEAGNPNHPDLWKTFATSLDAKEIEHHSPSLEMETLVETFRNICLHGTVSEGLAALYAYESQIPSICVSKIDGLKKHYDMQDPKSWSYFAVHIGADEEHSRVERELLAKHITCETVSSTKNAAQQILDCLWNFLSGLCHRYEILAC